MFYQCKMCGGTLEIENNDTVGVCEYCGTKQTLPRLDNDKKANLYDRAAHFRQSNDYDAARVLYEQVLAEDKTDAEAYWSIVLCRYGIEYVEDPATHKRIPTVNRAQYTSIFNDSDYKSALQYADPFQSEIYEQEAKAIDDIQKGILRISKNEEPFDIFICYKESDDNGRRTIDSVLAYDVYKELVSAGYKVFFSRVTLEDKVGTAYEPYIFAALNSAPIMLVIGTKKENFNAVWVKNEWSRFLGMIKSGAKKTLIPMYKDINPYDLPQEFAHLQAQDMNNLGYMQDLLRGINKISDNLVKKPIKAATESGNTDALMKRGLYELEYKEWDNAKSFFDQVLNHDPENGDAYIGLLMAELRVSKFRDLEKSTKRFDNSNEYKKAIRFAEPEVAEKLREYSKTVNTAIAERNKLVKYESAQSKFAEASTKNDYQSLLLLFQELGGYKNAVDYCSKCQVKIHQLEVTELEKVKKRKRRVIFVTSSTVFLLIVVLALAVTYKKVILPQKKYDEASTLMSSYKYDEAISIYEQLGDYKNSRERKKECEDQKPKYEKMQKILNAESGDIIEFGHYKGGNEWIVLEKRDDELLIMSNDSIGTQSYNDSSTSVTWETCALRGWLNETFVNEAFSELEQEAIIETQIDNPYNEKFGTFGGRPTKDKIWLLSTREVYKYFTKDFSENSNFEGWKNTCWLRTPGFTPLEAAVVHKDGKIGHVSVVRIKDVRPVMWIETTGLINEMDIGGSEDRE